MSTPPILVFAANPFQEINLISINEDKATFKVTFEVNRGSAQIGAINVDAKNAGMIYVNLRSLNHFFTGVDWDFAGTPIEHQKDIKFDVSYFSPEQIELAIRYQKGGPNTITLALAVRFQQKIHQLHKKPISH